MTNQFISIERNLFSFKNERIIINLKDISYMEVLENGPGDKINLVYFNGLKVMVTPKEYEIIKDAIFANYNCIDFKLNGGDKCQ